MVFCEEADGLGGATDGSKPLAVRIKFSNTTERVRADSGVAQTNSKVHSSASESPEGLASLLLLLLELLTLLLLLLLTYASPESSAELWK